MKSYEKSNHSNKVQIYVISLNDVSGNLSTSGKSKL